MRRILLTFGVLLLLGVTPFAEKAHAWGGVRIGIGLPLYVGPGPYYYGSPYPYYYPPTYVVPAPQVVYQTPPPAVGGSPAPVQRESIPAPLAKEVATSAPLPIVTNLVSANNQTSPQVDALMRQLADPAETIRRDAALQLGRLKAVNAVDALVNVLAKDTSPVARDGAARGLGLIASPTSLRSLIYAAQADNDHEVRHSAQFAVEVIRSNLRGN